MYAPTWDSVGTHPLPGWYDDAKLGIFLHWGLYSVPGWAPQVPDIQQLLKQEGPGQMLRDNPYAEWYLNTSRLEGSATWQHQRDTYGPDATYDDFVAPFDAGTSAADMDAIAAACKDAGARYVVLTTKHHEGFCLWDSEFTDFDIVATPHGRDLLGPLVKALTENGNLARGRIEQSGDD
jgi:alpha-L-fucosidase